jgi:hypothetical protein
MGNDAVPVILHSGNDMLTLLASNWTWHEERLTELIRGYESFAIRNKGCAEASDMAACTRSMAGGMAKDTVHWSDDHATVFGSEEVGFCGAGDCMGRDVAPNRTETMLGREHPAKQQHVDADSIAVVNSDISFAINPGSTVGRGPLSSWLRCRSYKVFRSLQLSIPVLQSATKVALL